MLHITGLLHSLTECYKSRDAERHLTATQHLLGKISAVHEAGMQPQFMVLNSHAGCACARLCKYFPQLSPRMKLKNWLNTEAFILTYSGVKATKASSTLIQSWISLISSGKESHVEYRVRKPPDKSLVSTISCSAVLQKVNVSDQHNLTLVSPVLSTPHRA